MIGSIQLGSIVSCNTFSILSMLDCSRYSTNIRPNELKAVVASHESMSAQAFSILGMWKISKCFKLAITSFIFWRYFIIVGSRASNSSLTCPAISCESVKTFKLSISSSLTIFKPTKSALYLAWLFEVLKLNWRAYSIIIPLKLMRMRSIPLSYALDLHQYVVPTLILSRP